MAMVGLLTKLKTRDSPKANESPRQDELTRTRSLSAPKLVLIPDDDNPLERVVSAVEPRITSSNGFTSVCEGPGPSDDGSLTLDHLAAPEITLLSATPDLSVPSSRRSSISDQPTITPSVSTATLTPVSPVASPVKSIRSRKARSPSSASGIAGALVASGMALPGAPMLGNRSLSQSTDDSDSLDSGHGSGGSLRPIPSMDALSMWDGVGTGYALASTRRNIDFHQLFGSVPEDDYLVEGTHAGRGLTVVHPAQTMAAPSRATSLFRVASTFRSTTFASMPTSLAGSRACVQASGTHVR
jgi:hypothetical protein